MMPTLANIIKINTMLPSNQINPILLANTTFSIESLSPKQILGQCIDLTTSLYKELVNHYIQNNKNAQNPFGQQKVDFGVLSNYVLDPARLEIILQQYVKGSDRSMRNMVKSWMHQLKSMRNHWAHSEGINLRIASRAFDTLSLLYEALEGDSNTELFKKIEMYRKALTIFHARLCLS